MFFVSTNIFLRLSAKKEHVTVIFFDLVKAYDTTWKHDILLDPYELDFRGHLPAFINGILSQRLFQVKAWSTLICMKMGVASYLLIVLA